MSAICAGLALWFAVLVITPTLDIRIDWVPATTTAWSSR